MKKIIGAGVVFTPFLAFAQLTETTNIINQIGDIIGILTPIVFTLAIIYFFWGLAQFILASGDDDAKTAGKQRMIWGTIAIFVMASIFGLVGFIQNELNIDDQAQDFDAPTVPTVNIPDA